MRILLMILAVLGLLLTSLVGLVGTKKHLDLSASMAVEAARISQDERRQLEADAAANPQLAEALAGLELPGKVRLAAVGLGLTGLAGLALLVALLAKKERAVLFAALALVALAGVTVLISPTYATAMGEPDARFWAVLQAICAGLGALTAFGATRLRCRQALSVA